MKSESPGSPSWNSTSPFRKRRLRRLWAIARRDSVPNPLKSGQRPSASTAKSFVMAKW